MAKDTIRVQFNQDRVVDDERKGTPREERYKKGQTVDLPRAKALRWIGRGVAEEVVARSSRKKPAETGQKAAPGGTGGGASQPKTQA